MDFIDMFAGMGTARMALEKAGHKCVYSIEWDKHKRKIYEVIFGNEPDGNDIRAIDYRQLPRADVWTAGFPCQDISVAGNQLGFNGHRSSLFFAVTKLIREMPEENLPSYLLFENVKNFFSVNRGYDFLKAFIELDEIGYDCEWQLLNSKHFGVPQNRERVFIVGHLRGRSTRKVFPIERSNSETLKQIIGGSQGNRVYDVTGLSCTLASQAGGQGAKTGLYAVSACLTPDRAEKRQNGRRFKSKSIFRLTPRECMRLQGVDDYITDKLIEAGISDTQMYKAAGDAWTVNVGYEIAIRMSVD